MLKTKLPDAFCSQRFSLRIWLIGGLILSYLALVPVQSGANEWVEPSISQNRASQPPVSSKVARTELQELMNVGMRMLAKELVEQGTFYPFVAMLGHDGEMRLIGMPTVLRKHNANPNTMVDALVEKVKALAQEKRVRAAAFFMDYYAQRTDTGFSQQGIRVELNHIHPDMLSVFVPYVVTDDEKLRLMTPQYSSGKNVVFNLTGSKK